MSRDIRALAVDFDGVIVDSMPLQESAWRQALDSVTPEVNETTTEQLIKNLWAGHAVHRMFDGVALSSDQRRLARYEKDRIWEKCRSSVPIMEGAVEALRRLSQEVPLFVATTAPRTYVEEILKREALAEAFRCIVTDSDVERPKPAPDMLKKIAEHISSNPSHLLFIGDSVTDFEMAQVAVSRFLLLDVHARFRPDELKADIALSWKEAMYFVLAALGTGPIVKP